VANGQRRTAAKIAGAVVGELVAVERDLGLLYEVAVFNQIQPAAGIIGFVVDEGIAGQVDRGITKLRLNAAAVAVLGRVVLEGAVFYIDLRKVGNIQVQTTAAAVDDGIGVEVGARN